MISTSTAPKKILVVEDTPSHQQFAKQSLLEHEVEIVSNLADADHYLESNRPDAILTDLYFPAGKLNPHALVSHTQCLKSVFEDYLKIAHPVKQRGPLYGALVQVSKLFKMTPEEYMAGPFSSVHDEHMREPCMDEIFERENYAGFCKAKSILDTMSTCDTDVAGLPLGIITALQSRQNSILVCIVTDKNHHDITFEPYRRLLNASDGKPPIQYIDSLVNGQKPWRNALDKLFNNINIDK